MSVLQAILLGIVQGITEFLPISSSGHLVLGKALLGIHTQGIAFEVFVHFGTFLAVLTIFWGDCWNILRAWGNVLRHPSPGHWSLCYQEDPFFRLGFLIVLATIPAVVIGLLFEHQVEAAFSHPLFVSFALLVTGTILLGTRWTKPKDTRFGVVRAFIIGCAQAFAILPGISRAGSTIAAGMYTGVERSEAARFSFLLALPVILGACVVKGKELLHTGIPAEEGVTLLIGTIVAYVVGVVALKWLLGVIRRGRLDWFAYYCYAVGLAGIIWFARGTFF
jgi:undecaprenyl-diphosphatase